MIKRIDKDFYETPIALTNILRSFVEIDDKEIIFEPCAGELAIASCFSRVITNDLDTSKTTDYHFDAAQADMWPLDLSYDWVVTNPPYNVAEKIIPECFKRAQVGVAALLRLSYLEPTRGRGDWLKMAASHLTNLIVFNPRPRYRPDVRGTDSVTSAWFVWKRYRRTDERYATYVQFVTDWRDK